MTPEEQRKKMLTLYAGKVERLMGLMIRDMGGDSAVVMLGTALGYSVGNAGQTLTGIDATLTGIVETARIAAYNAFATKIGNDNDARA